MVHQRSLPRYIGPEVDVGTDGRKMTQEEVRARFDAEVATAYSRGRGLPWLPEHAAVMSLVIETLRAYLPARAGFKIWVRGRETWRAASCRRSRIVT